MHEQNLDKTIDNEIATWSVGPRFFMTRTAPGGVGEYPFPEASSSILRVNRQLRQRSKRISLYPLKTARKLSIQPGTANSAPCCTSMMHLFFSRDVQPASQSRLYLQRRSKTNQPAPSRP